MRCELHLVRRRGELEGHGEHQGDGAEGLQPLTRAGGGRRTCQHTNVVVGWTVFCKLGDQILDADEAAVQLRLLRSMLTGGGRAPRAIKVGVVSHRQALSLPRGRTMESDRFVADSSLPLMEPPSTMSMCVC